MISGAVLCVFRLLLQLDYMYGFIFNSKHYYSEKHAHDFGLHFVNWGKTHSMQSLFICKYSTKQL